MTTATKADTRVPVTVLTGFLGSGKTTLLNRILTEQHGKRIAVIENEFGEIGIDDALIVKADEEIFEMNNGCICCTVRGDLIRILGNLMKRRDRFDAILVETTGMADPAPVAQTFFVDDEVRERVRLDGIVTLVDSKHIWQHLDTSKEAVEQLAFADVLVLNKIDLVPPGEVDRLEQRVRKVNAMARIHRTSMASVPIDVVLDVGGFDLERALQVKPTFLELEYPFEWAGAFALGPGAHTLALEEGPDPTMKLLAAPLGPGELLETAKDRLAVAFADRRSAERLRPGDKFWPGQGLVELQLEAPGSKRFTLEVAAPTELVLATQHLPAEFKLALLGPDGRKLDPRAERTFVATHVHEKSVTSVGIELEGQVDGKKLNAWIGKLLRERGVDLYRSKGILNMKGDDRRFVFQAVHMLFDGQPDRAWREDERRMSQLVFIGRNLDRAELTKGFQACLA